MSGTFKQDKLRDFTVIRNAIFKDYTLSAKAKGVACQLLSLPPTWDYSVKGIVTLFSDGEASIRNALQELEDHGYLHRERERNEGKLGRCIYVITDSLNCEKPNVENPRVDNPRVDNHAQLNTKELKTKESNTEELYNVEFENLWKAYPRKMGKLQAMKHYKKARKDGATYDEVMDGIVAYANYIKATNTEDRYIKHGSTFFSEHAWQDDWTVKGSSISSSNPFLDMLKAGDF